MTSVVSTRTLITIAVLTAGLIGLEHATSAVLNLLRGLATTKRFLVFFLTSVVITLFCKRFIRIEDTSDPSVGYLYLDEDEVLSESGDLFEDDSQEYVTERYYPRAARSLAPSPSLISRNSRTTAPAPAPPPAITRDRLPKTSPLAPTHEHQEHGSKSKLPPTTVGDICYDLLSRILPTFRSSRTCALQLRPQIVFPVRILAKSAERRGDDTIPVHCVHRALDYPLHLWISAAHRRRAISSHIRAYLPRCHSQGNRRLEDDFPMLLPHVRASVTIAYPPLSYNQCLARTPILPSSTVLRRISGPHYRVSASFKCSLRV